MKYLSKWASAHPFASQMLITISGFAVSTLACLLASILYFEGIIIPLESLYIILPITLLTVLFYPIKHVKKGFFKSTYRKRKSMDVVLILAGFLLVLVFNNQLTHETTLNTSISSTNSYAHFTGYASNDAAPVAKKSWRSRVIMKKIKKWNRKLVKPLKRTWKRNSPIQQTVAIMVIIAAFILFGGLILGLSCNLSCSGANFLAGLLLLVGGGALITFTVVLIRRVLGIGKKKSNKSKEKPKE